MYGSSWHVTFGGSLENAINDYKSRINDIFLKIPDLEIPRLGHTLIKYGILEGMIWLDKDAGPGVIAHESFHAATFIFDTLGMPKITRQNDEALAYYLQWIVDEIYYSRRRKRKKK